MAQCNGQDGPSTAVTLRIRAAPCPLKASGTACEHITELENRRSSRLFSVRVYSKTLLQLVDFTKPGDPPTVDVLEVHPVISSNYTQRNPYAVTMNSKNTTEEVTTSAKFADGSQKTTVEELVAYYELPLPA